MTAPGMRAKVATSAKPVTKRKYFPNLLIFDSPLFSGLNSGSCLGLGERKVHPAISLKWQSPGSLVVVRATQVISVHFAADSMAEPCGCPLVESIVDAPVNTRISYVVGNLPKRLVLQDDGGHGGIGQRDRVSGFPVKTPQHLGRSVARTAVG